MTPLTLKYRGNFKNLSVLLRDLFDRDNWKELTPNLFQNSHESGVIINWFQETGTIYITGDMAAVDIITQEIDNILSGKDITSVPIKQQLIENNNVIGDLINNNKLFAGRYSDTELLIGIVSAVGAESRIVTQYIEEILKIHAYNIEHISISRDVISKIKTPRTSFKSEIDRINHFMDLGNEIRDEANDYSVLALGVSAHIFDLRELDENGDPIPKKKQAYIINSLKHPDEVARLREIYTEGFYLIGIAEHESRRIQRLLRDHNSDEPDAEKLIARDRDESNDHGQHTRDAFQLSDFFVNLDGNIDKIRADLDRIFGLIFGHPYLTPTFDEYAMFMAFTSALRSSDLSRQVGAVIARDNEILASGANDCPKATGGLYWPETGANGGIVDAEGGRDYTRGFDSNKHEQRKIIQNILDNLPDTVEKEVVRETLQSSYLKDITEYGRIVHAEMEALMFCSRNNISARKSTLYCTTFPCHNCAKHIIASGIDKVIYIEPYPKSKAFEFYSDSITSDINDKSRVQFLPFVGVGPRRFFDLFSMNLSTGYSIKRKSSDGSIINHHPEKSKARIQMLPCSYLEKENFASYVLGEFLKKQK